MSVYLLKKVARTSDKIVQLVRHLTLPDNNRWNNKLMRTIKKSNK